MKSNVIYEGDNLKIIRSFESNLIDLIYIDPPFFTQSIRKQGDIEFSDKWKGGMNSYLKWIISRLKECYRLLKETGVFCIHLDQRSSHYIKVELDKIFGMNHFINEIIWHYRRWSNVSRHFQKMHDTIFLYSKTSQYFNCIPNQKYSNKKYIEDTVRKIVDGKLKRVKDSNGNYIKRKKQNDGVPMHDVFHDINFISPNSKERIGYPTQKPLSLLNRIIQAFTNKGDLVLDSFCGSGTTLSSAQGLQRRWIGIDSSKDAIDITKKRMKRDHNLEVEVISEQRSST